MPMQLPTFLLGDNTDNPDDAYVVHLEYPRFVLNIADGDIEWLEEFSQQDQEELQADGHKLIEGAMAFYERELERYSDD